MLNFAAEAPKFVMHKAEHPGDLALVETQKNNFTCEVKIYNNSYDRLHAYANFDDGATLSIDIYAREIHGLSLYYYGYCHNGLYLTLDRLHYGIWNRIFDGYVPVNYAAIVNDDYNLKSVNKQVTINKS